MQDIRLKVVSSDDPGNFENYINEFLSGLDAAGQEYKMSFNGVDKHCAYITYSTPKIKTPIFDSKEHKYCFRACDEAVVRSDTTAYCLHHKKVIKRGGYCCLEYYEGGL